MRTARTACVVGATLWLLVWAPAFAQRMQFPTTVPPAGPVPGPVAAGPAPMATLEGTIQPPPVQWDPYATPGATPPTLLPQDPYLQPGGIFPPSDTFTRMQRLVQEVRLDYVWMPGNGPTEFGILDADLSVTVALPLFFNTQTPLLVTPGFAAHYWNGPISVGPAPTPDLPPRVFDAYLDTAWNPQLTPWFGGELDFRIGIYSDFERVLAESIRYKGKGMAVLSFSPSVQVKAGIWYLDRVKIKMLPAGGLVWTPNSDIRFEILFPNPKFARRLPNVGNCEWWFTLRGEYGGGVWSVKRVNADPAIDGQIDLVDYNDLRAAVGLEFANQAHLRGLFEVGIAFEREIVYRSQQPPDFRPHPTVFVHGGLAY